MYKYDDMMRWYFGQYKFNGGYHLRSIFQEVFSVFIRQHAADMYVPIPVSQRTAQTRGFNQVAGLLDFEAELDILACAGTEKAVQSMKTRGERLHSMQPFVLKAGGISVQNQTICLIDDVYTTGTTLRHAAQCFYEAGAKRVCSVTLAR
jgi:competence protein ComFC